MNAAEQQVIEQLIPELESQGFTVYIEPSRQVLPPFMNGYVPDAIALRGDKKIAFEILSDALSDRQGVSEKMEMVRHQFENASDWEFRVLYARPGSDSRELQPASSELIAGSLQEVEGLLNSGHNNAAVLMGWAALESIARRLAPAEFSRAQTPMRLIERLARDGYVTPNEADDLRILAGVRNETIHGVLNRAVSTGKVQAFVRVLNTLFKLLSAN